MDTHQKIEILKKFELFKNLSSPQLKLISIKVTEKKFLKKDLLIEQDDSDDSVYLIYEGIARIYRLNEDGREINLTVVGEGQAIGEMTPIVGGVRTAYAEAQTNLSAFVLKGSDLRNLIKDDEIAINFLKVFCERLAYANKHLEEVMSQSLKDRTLALLTSLSKQLSTKAIEITQEELANILSATRPRVSEVLQELEKEKSIELSHRTIILTS